MVLGVELSQLRALFLEAKRLTEHGEYVVVGSLSILGIARNSSEIPDRMLMSIDVDCFTKTDPERIFELREKLGQGSRFEQEHGYYLDPVSPHLPTLPDQWEFRLVRVQLGEEILVHFLDPNDAAVSKYARCDARDREWIRAGLQAHLLSPHVIESRFRQTEFLDETERERAYRALAEDRQAMRRG